MRYAFIASALAVSVNAHGLISQIYGANGVKMLGCTVTDGTPRNCVANACGAQADTGIIRDQDIVSKTTGPAGKTQGSGKVDCERTLAIYMGSQSPDSAPTNKAASSGLDDILPQGVLLGRGGKSKRGNTKRQAGGLFGGLGGIGQMIGNVPVVGVLGTGETLDTSYMGDVEHRVKSTAGNGKKDGLPTADKNGVVTMGWFQVNQDGAGPLTAAIDCTSGGKDPNAFKTAQVVQNAPGSGVSGLSIATLVEYKVQIKMPKECQGCSGKLAGVDNVCVARVRNQALAGPFGGSGIFTTSQPAKRAVDFTA
ncbi:cell surface protein (Mas1) [Purpureocillium lavendulum]|uniref:Cell surface protein (Mas1) n=1 Tax=Purpureocillium lavendulum TaxID=1247861 RepID=A0AB34FP65_9HYPO|nr:cell surface protein (Mas1) [Purpureocillium lavendulum]